MTYIATSLAMFIWSQAILWTISDLFSIWPKEHASVKTEPKRVC